MIMKIISGILLLLTAVLSFKHGWDGLTKTVKPGAPDLRHTDGANFLYYDGHVKWSKSSLDSNGNPCKWYLAKPDACK